MINKPDYKQAAVAVCHTLRPLSRLWDITSSVRLSEICSWDFAACWPVSGKPSRRSLLWSGRWADCGECIILQEIEPPLSPSDSEDSLNRFLLYGETRLLSTACPSAVNVRALLQRAAATWIPVWWRPFWNGQLVTTCWPASHCLRKKVWHQLAHTTRQHKNKLNVYFFQLQNFVTEDQGRGGSSYYV